MSRVIVSPDARLYERFKWLLEFPNAGRPFPRPELDQLRVWPERPYLIFYHREGGDIVIVNVVHGARDYESLFSDDETD